MIKIFVYHCFLGGRIYTRVSTELHYGLLLLQSDSEYFSLYSRLWRNPLAHSRLSASCLDNPLHLLCTGDQHFRQGLLNRLQDYGLSIS